MQYSGCTRGPNPFITACLYILHHMGRLRAANGLQKSETHLADPPIALVRLAGLLPTLKHLYHDFLRNCTLSTILQYLLSFNCMLSICSPLQVELSEDWSDLTRMTAVARTCSTTFQHVDTR